MASGPQATGARDDNLPIGDCDFEIFPCALLKVRWQGTDEILLFGLNAMAAEVLRVDSRELPFDALGYAPGEMARLQDALAAEPEATTPLSIDIQAGDATAPRWLRWRVATDGVGGRIVALEELQDEGVPDSDDQVADHVHSEAARAALENMRARATFLARMSHELRTPLNAIIGFSSIISGQTFGAIGSRYVEYAKHINDSAEHLLELVSDVLELSRAESGDLELDLVVCEVPDEIAQVVRSLAAQVDRAGVQLDVEVSDDLPSITVDRARFRLVLRHLLVNAIKFSPARSVVRLAVSRDESAALAFKVADSGIGMTEQDISIAFGMFDQVDDRLERRYEGLGVGLPLARRLVEMMGGTLSIETQKGAGTTVIVRLGANERG